MAGGGQGGGGRPAVGGNMQQFQNALQNYRQGSAGMPSQFPGANMAAPGGGMPQGQAQPMPRPMPAPAGQQNFYGGPPPGYMPPQMPQGPVNPYTGVVAPPPQMPQGQAPISVGAYQTPPAPQGQPMPQPLPQPLPQAQPMPRPIPQGMPQVMGNPNAMPLQRPQMGQTRPMMLRGRR